MTAANEDEIRMLRKDRDMWQWRATTAEQALADIHLAVLAAVRGWRKAASTAPEDQ